MVTLTDRLGRVRASLLLALQAGVAAGLAWYVAHDLIGQCASSAVLVATLAPPAGGIYYTRFVDDVSAIRAVRRAVGRLTS